MTTSHTTGSLPVFTFASGSQVLTVHSTKAQHITIGHRAVPQWWDSPSDSRILCGIIPFNTNEPSTLFFTDNYTWSARPSGLPQLSNTSTGEDCGATDEDTQYIEAVERALGFISKGALEKIVLARQKHLKLPSSCPQISMDSTMFNQLLATSPTADIFRVYTDPLTAWIGASPEIIADVNQQTFTSHPLAGSLSRRSELNPEKANAILSASDKDLREHAYLVQHIKETLSSLALEHLVVPSHPSVISTDTMWHLGTKITGQTDLSALEIALALHPTPAIGGIPVQAALDGIRSLEKEPRNFYSGMVGWVDARGNGRWSLVLRCARRENRKVTLFAGAGIVEGSDPRAELAETQAKMRTIQNVIDQLQKSHAQRAA